MDSTEAIIENVVGIPKDLTEEDVPDLVELATHYATLTPPDFIQYASELCYRDQDGSSGSSSLAAALCLEVSAKSLFVSMSNQRSQLYAPSFNSMLIDVRPTTRYDIGHVAQSYHVDPSLMMSNPEEFEKILTQLQTDIEASNASPCFIGTSGQDELLFMVVSKMLQQKHTKCTSICRGGFKAIYEYLSSNSLLERHLEAKEQVASVEAILAEPDTVDEANEEDAKVHQKAPTMWSRWKSKTSDVASRIKQKTSAAIAQSSQRFQFGKSSTLYRETDISNFSIDDESDDEGEHASKHKTTKQQQHLQEADVDGKKKSSPLVSRTARFLRSAKEAIKNATSRLATHQDDLTPLDKIMLDVFGETILGRTQLGSIVIDVTKLDTLDTLSHFYQCSEIDHEGYLIPSWIILTDYHIFKLRDLNPGRDQSSTKSQLQWCRPIGSVFKMTSRKKNPNIVSFWFKEGSVIDDDTSRKVEAGPLSSTESADAQDEGVESKAEDITQEETQETQETQDLQPTPEVEEGNDDVHDAEGSQNANDGSDDKDGATEGSQDKKDSTQDDTKLEEARDTTEAKASTQESQKTQEGSDKHQDGEKERFLIPQSDEAKAAFLNILAQRSHGP